MSVFHGWMQTKRVLVAVVMGVATVALLAACAATGNDLTGTPGAERGPVGFWWGLWHGFIAPVTFIVSLFTETVGVYEVHNTGGWYDFGFLLGLSVIFGGGPAGAGRRKR